MATAPNTGSTLTLPSGINKTSTALSTNIIIMVNNRAIGAIQQLSVNEQRQLKQVDEIGTDGHIDSVPMSSTNITGNCQRIRYDRLRISEAFSRGFLHVASQIYPFDIIILDKQKKDRANQISTVIKNVWIKSISYTYNADNWVITDTMDWEAERIFSVLNGGSSPISGGTPAAVGGETNVLHLGYGLNGVGITSAEQLADTGSNGQGGALDTAGLIDLGSDGSNLF